MRARRWPFGPRERFPECASTLFRRTSFRSISQFSNRSDRVLRWWFRLTGAEIPDLLSTWVLGIAWSKPARGDRVKLDTPILGLNFRLADKRCVVYLQGVVLLNSCRFGQLWWQHHAQVQDRVYTRPREVKMVSSSTVAGFSTRSTLVTYGISCRWLSWNAPPWLRPIFIWNEIFLLYSRWFWPVSCPMANFPSEVLQKKMIPPERYICLQREVIEQRLKVS